MTRLRLAFKEVVTADVVYALSGGKCGICGSELSRLEMHIDHVVPLALGGEHSYANVQAAHKKCNSRKGARWSGGFNTTTSGA